jgi:arylsulfatase A-like enzyme
MRSYGFPRRVVLLLAVALIPLFSFGQEPGKPASPEIKNVLFLVVDDCNTWLLTDPDRYTGRVIAPNIQRLAQEGVLFHNAYTASPLCVPSRTAFLSGVAPWKSGVYQNQAAVMESEILNQVPSLYDIFHKNGFFTTKIGKISHGLKLNIAPDVVMGHKRTPRPPGAPLNGIGGGTERDWGATHLDEKDMSEAKLADRAIECLQMKHDKPFFIACGFFHPHYPWYVPQKYLDMYPLEKIVLPPVKDDDHDDTSPIGRAFTNPGWDQKVKESGNVKKAIQGYLASVSLSDAHLGRVLDALDNGPYRENTMVVMLSDHGFHLGEKQQWSKGTLWEEATDSLLMFRVPGVTKPGQVCRQPVSLLDIYPTLMDLMGFDKPDHLDGLSLLPQLRDVEAPRGRPAISALSGSITVRTKDYRYIRYTDGSTELYDRGKDPNEWTNQTDNPEFKETKAKLEAMLPAPDEMAPMVRNPKKNPLPKKSRKKK